jgi:hypothetical protein
MSIFTRTTKLAALRKSSHSLSHLPDTVRIPQQQDRHEEAVKPIETVTLDDIAFALLGLQEMSMAIYRQTEALRNLYELARKTGAVGADVALDAIPAEKGGK